MRSLIWGAVLGALLAQAATAQELVPVTVPRGQGCQTDLIPVGERGEPGIWGHFCPISANTARYWCLNGSAFDSPNNRPTGKADCGSIAANRPSAEAEIAARASCFNEFGRKKSAGELPSNADANGYVRWCLQQSKPGASASSAAASTSGPSFDCTKATSAAARLICSDAELSGLDRRMGEAFRRTLGGLTGAPRDAAIDEQRKWINNRNTKCGLTPARSTAPVDDLVGTKPCMVAALIDREKQLGGRGQAIAGGQGAAPSTSSTAAEPPRSNQSAATPAKEDSLFTLRKFDVNCNSFMFPWGHATMVVGAEYYDRFQDDSYVNEILKVVLNWTTSRCGFALQSARAEIGDDQNRLILSGEWAGSNWRTTNHVKIAAVQRATVERKRRIRMDFVTQYQVARFARPEEVLQNPFIFKETIVGVRANFQRMIGQNDALFELPSHLPSLAVTNVPTTQFRGSEELVLAVRISGVKDGMPTGSFVGAYQCQSSRCAEFYD